MLILGLDTTQPNAQIALLNQNQKILETEIFLPRMEQLPSKLSSLFQSLEIQPTELRAAGFVTGPGNYTGIRAGLIVLKTLTSIYHLPLYGFTRMETALFSLRSLPQPVSPLFNIRQNQIYTALGQWQNDQPLYALPPQIQTWDSWLQNLPWQPLFFCSDPQPFACLPLGNMALAAAEMTQACLHRSVSPPDSVHPFYIRPAVQTLVNA